MLSHISYSDNTTAGLPCSNTTTNLLLTMAKERLAEQIHLWCFWAVFWCMNHHYRELCDNFAVSAICLHGAFPKGLSTKETKNKPTKQKSQLLSKIPPKLMHHTWHNPGTSRYHHSTVRLSWHPSACPLPSEQGLMPLPFSDSSFHV